ncbi:MAG: S24/S26 family peptidase [Bacteroidales bacterium]|nr:S24/S26 family peptidase [Bacteroidales bacterium]
MHAMTLPNRLFFEAVCQRLQAQRSVRILVAGRSMEPFLKNGKDFITLSALPSDYRFRKGDVLLFVYGGQYVVHRLHRIHGDTLYMKGDHQNHWEIIHPEDVRGWVSCVQYANGRRISARSFFWKTRSLRSRLNRMRKNFNHKIKRISSL